MVFQQFQLEAISLRQTPIINFRKGADSIRLSGSARLHFMSWTMEESCFTVNKLLGPIQQVVAFPCALSIKCFEILWGSRLYIHVRRVLLLLLFFFFFFFFFNSLYTSPLFFFSCYMHLLYHTNLQTLLKLETASHPHLGKLCRYQTYPCRIAIVSWSINI